jgi:hypothetical protein
MKKTIITLLLLIICTTKIWGQLEVITPDGRKVILKNDGTWNYLDTAVKKNTINSFTCQDLILTELDKVTGETYISAKELLVVSQNGGKTGFGIYLMKVTGGIALNMTAVGAGNCIDDDDKMNILFRDGSRLELTQDGDFNCKSEFVLYFGGSFGKKRALEELGTKQIATMRVWTSDGYVEEDFSEQLSLQIMKTIDCLLIN